MNDPLEISTLGSLSIQRGGEPVTGPASRYPLVVNSHWFKDVAGRHIAATLAIARGRSGAGARSGAGLGSHRGGAVG